MLKNTNNAADALAAKSSTARKHAMESIWPTHRAPLKEKAQSKCSNTTTNTAVALAAKSSTARKHARENIWAQRGHEKAGMCKLVKNTYNAAVALAAWSSAAGKRAREKMWVGCRKAPPPPCLASPARQVCMPNSSTWAPWRGQKACAHFNVLQARNESMPFKRKGKAHPQLLLNQDKLLTLHSRIGIGPRLRPRGAGLDLVVDLMDARHLQGQEGRASTVKHWAARHVTQHGIELCIELHSASAQHDAHAL
eukprot:1159972-Pelagomonas_calceolata.AAC.5